MKILTHKGTSRYAICIPPFRIAIKLPIIHFINYYQLITKPKIKWSFLLRTLRSGVYSPISLRGQLFRGFVDNWNEFCFYQKTRHRFIQPTYFSLFGLINVQKMGNKCPLFWKDHWQQIKEITNEACAGSHHFCNPSNFCLEDTTLRILDYGSPITQENIIKFGNVIQKI